MTIIDQGVVREVNIFVACLPCSGLIYAEGSWTQGTEDWLSTHVRLFQFIGGVPARVVPDNLKTGVTHASYWDPVINASYAALIRHYGTVVLPARKGKPKDKPSAESGVIQVYRWLLADSDLSGQAFRLESGHPFRSGSGHLYRGVSAKRAPHSPSLP